MTGGQLYVGVTREKIYSERPINITTRSSPARIGAETRPVNTNFHRPTSHAYMLMRTYDTECEIPEGEKLTQIEVDPTHVASRETVEDLVRNDRLVVVTDHLSPDFRKPHPKLSYLHMYENGVVLHLGRLLRKYKGGTLHIGQNNDSCFELIDIAEIIREMGKRTRNAISLAYMIEPCRFHLGETYESVGLPDDYAVMLEKIHGDWLRGNIDSHAPLVAAGSPVHKIVYELYFPDGMAVHEGMAIGQMNLHALDQKPEKPYRGRYTGQSDVQTSLSHHGL